MIKKIQQMLSTFKKEIKDFLHEREIYENEAIRRYTRNFVFLFLLFPTITFAYSDIVETMTSSTGADSIVSSNCTTYLSFYEWKAFDNNNATYFYCYPFFSYDPATLQVEMTDGNQYIVDKIGIVGNENGNNYEPEDFEFQGSNDGSTWTTIHSETGITSGWTSGVERFFTFATSSPYSYFRLYVTDVTYPSDNSWQQPELNIYGDIYVAGEESETTEINWGSATTTNQMLGSINFGLAILIVFFMIGFSGYVWNKFGNKKPWMK